MMLPHLPSIHMADPAAPGASITLERLARIPAFRPAQLCGSAPISPLRRNRALRAALQKIRASCRTLYVRGTKCPFVAVSAIVPGSKWPAYARFLPFRGPSAVFYFPSIRRKMRHTPTTPYVDSLYFCFLKLLNRFQMVYGQNCSLKQHFLLHDLSFFDIPQSFVQANGASKNPARGAPAYSSRRTSSGLNPKMR